MGNFIFLQILAAVCALSIITTLFNKRILDFPQAIGVPIVSAVLVFILQWSASLLNGNQFITIIGTGQKFIILTETVFSSAVFFN